MTARSYSGSYITKPLPALTRINDSPTIPISHLIDYIVKTCNSRSLNESIEMAFINQFNITKAFCFLLDDTKQSLFCSSLFRFAPLENSITAICFKEKKTLVFQNPTKDPNFNVAIDPCVSDENTAFVPLISASNECIGVAVLCKRGVLRPKDVDRLTRFPQRFSHYIDFLTSHNRQYDKPANCSLETIRLHFGAKQVDMLKLEKNEFTMFDLSSGLFEPVATPGCAEEALKNEVQIMYTNVKASPTYSAQIDGERNDPVLIQPFSVGPVRYAYVIRGKTNGTTFTSIDGVKMEAIAPLVAYEMEQTLFEDSNQDSIYSERLEALLEVAEAIFGVLDLDTLIPIIMDKACSLLNTERCSLFTVDKASGELVTRFHGGLDEAIRVKIGVGIAGYTAQTGKCVNITDAYDDPRFDKTSDLQTGFTTKTILTVPIYDNRGSIAGVTEMINRRDGNAFDKSDIQLMKAFNVFCGISLDNANLYNTSLQLMSQLRGFISTSAAISHQEKPVDQIILDILETMKTVVNGVFSVAYSYDNETDTLTKLASTGHPLDEDTTYAERVIQTREMQCVILADEKPEEEEKSSKLRVNPSMAKFRFMKASQKFDDQGIAVKRIMAFPLLTNDNQMLGVVETGTNNLVLLEDVKLLNCFSVFIALSLEKENLKQVASLGKVEVRLKKLMRDYEKGVGDIPQALRIEESKKSTIFAINFDAPRWDGVGHFRVLFAIFNEFKLLQHFKIKNETFLHFINEISMTYNKVPYHNWRHAVDVTQFVAYQVKTAQLDKVFTKLELYCLLVAAICHDANHDGFTNVYNEKAETPLGILFKNQSVMETHHCQVAIHVSTKEECNIFSGFDSATYKHIWTMIIQLILATDMAKHHSTLQAANEKLDKSPIDPNKEADRMMVMELVLKCGDISNVSRPFELADKWCDVLCEEFFRQGDLEKTNGMEYTSPLNDRAHLDKPKSQIGFYTFVCLPLYETAARAVPALQVNVDQIKSNLAVWKSRIPAAPPQ